MESILREVDGKLVLRFDSEILWIEPWGADSLRVRATHWAEMPNEDWALLPPPASKARIVIKDGRASIVNGKIEAKVDAKGRISFYRTGGALLAQEYQRNWDSEGTPCAIRVMNREFSPIPGGDYRLTVRFEAFPGEKIFGMGQYQQSRSERRR